MFRKFKQNLVFMYTLSTGLILTLIVILAFLFTYVSQANRRESNFQNLLFTLTSRLQTDSTFNDSYLAEMELQNQLMIHIEENGQALFFPGSYVTGKNRSLLLNLAGKQAETEGIYKNSQPISSDMLKSSVFHIQDGSHGSWLGNVLVLRTSDGHKKMVLLSDETPDKISLLKTSLFYLLMDLAGILLLYLTGRRFVRRTTAPLEETYQKQQEFIASASHELRSPLAVIQANADAIADIPSEGPRLLPIIRKECDRGSALIKNLLLLANVDRNDFVPQRQNLEIDELLLYILEMYVPVFKAKGGILLLELPNETLPSVKADPEICRQIFSVLLENALSYGLRDETGNKVKLKAEKTAKTLSVAVIDYGMGIPDEDKERVFERFYKGDPSRNKKDHFGLGLSIARQLSELQGFALKVADTQGGGCTFIVKFSID